MNLDLAADEDLQWHQDARFKERALAALEDSGLGMELDGMGFDFADPVPLDRKALAKAATAKKIKRIELTSAAGGSLAIFVGGVLADVKGWKIPITKAALDGLIAWACAAAKLPEGRARANRGTVYPIDLEIPARRPPVSHDYVRLGTLVDLFGPAWLAEKDPDLARVAAEAPLPEGASRIRDDELIVLRWIDDPRSPDALAEACVRQEDWWRAHVDMVPEGGWSAGGDLGAFPSALEPGAPFTLVDRAQRTGYRAVVVMPDGSLDGASWSEIAKLTATRQLADGTAIERVRLIVPVRDNAVAIASRARELGVDAVLYQDGDTLRNPTPPGNWRDAPELTPASRRREP